MMIEFKQYLRERTDISRGIFKDTNKKGANFAENYTVLISYKLQDKDKDFLNKIFKDTSQINAIKDDLKSYYDEYGIDILNNFLYNQMLNMIGIITDLRVIRQDNMMQYIQKIQEISEVDKYKLEKGEEGQQILTYTPDKDSGLSFVDKNSGEEKKFPVSKLQIFIIPSFKSNVIVEAQKVFNDYYNTTFTVI